MRRIVFAPSFDQDAEEIGAYIESTFGEAARREFVTDLSITCTLLVSLPHLGKFEHGYDTQSAGFPTEHNWIFFDYDDDEVRFVHIVSNSRDKRNVGF